MNIESAINNLIEYKVGIYVRLSREDDPKDVSESIKNQKDFLLDYIRKQDNWYLVDIYSDDGYSGTNFDRPDFIRMIKDVEDGKVNLVITKDLSRLGRDYIETGHYMERYFPSKRVRYIAVNDGIDTQAKDSSNNEMGAFKSVVNDMYARDISKKVRTAKRTRVEKGLFLGAFAPYGYTKDLNNKNRLVIDKEVSGVIKGIFYECLSGKTYTEIARDLNDRNIDSPFKYKKRNTKFYCSSNADLWSGNTVKKILTNQTYIGDLVQHKKEVINYKLKKTIDIPKSEYIIVENTHESIIEKSDFYLVQELVKKKCHGSHSKDINNHLLSGLIYCPRCGGRYSYANKNNKTGEKVIICDTYRRYGKAYCSRIAIEERDINRYVLQNLKEVISEKLDKNKTINSIKSNVGVHTCAQEEIKEQIEKNKKRIDEISSIIKNIYEDKFNKIITETEFNMITEEYRKEREIILNRISLLEQDFKRYANENEEEDKETIKLIRDVLDMKKVNKNILVRLIDRIEIIGKENIKIKYKFSV